MGLKMAKKITACDGCFGNIEGNCLWGGDTKNPPQTGKSCKARLISQQKVVAEFIIADGRACKWPQHTS